MKSKIFDLRGLLTAFMLCFMLSAAAQVSVKGVVQDKSGEPLIGATVQEKGNTGNGSATDIDGRFVLKVKSAKAVLLVSYVGMKPQEVALNGRTDLTITLEDDSELLDEVVVVGYGTQRKSDITGSVASISEDQMKQTIVTNADQMLQGKIAGVQVTQNSGAPGGATSVRIRGASSLNSSNEPLYVIDGVPMSGSNSVQGFDWMGGSNGQTTVNPLASIAPSDIVSIDVLKDASACAIYGAAGANGVVLVTTRRGSAGHSNITYDGYVAWQTVAKRLDMMNLREYALYQQQLLAEGVLNEGNFDDTYSDISLLGKGTDWQDEIFRTAFMQNHQLSMTGGNEKTVYAMSAGWMKQDGIIVGSDFTRFNSRFNLDNNFTKWLKAGGALAITRNDGSDGVIMQAMTMMPSVPVRDFDGNWAGPNTVNGASTWNPVALALMTNNTLLRQKVTGNFYLNADFLKHFTFRAEYAFDASQNQNKSFIPTYKFGLVSNDINQMMQREEHNFYWMQKDYVTYNQKFLDKHDVTVMAGFEVSKSSWNGTMLIKNNFSSDNIHIMGEDGDFVKNSGWADASSSASVFARANYAFDNRYLLTATVRRDGSSKFGANNKWGTFPSMALAWRASQEKFLQDQEWLNNLKLRLGYGKVGNSNIDTYLYGSAMQTLVTPGGTAYIPKNLANPDLKWEASEQWNIGLDFAALDNRIEFTVDAYHKQTQDLLMQTFVPSHIGSNEWGEINTPWANIGKTRNIGIDIQINARPVVTKNFHWNSALTISHNRNKIVALNDDSQRIYGKVDWYAPFQTVSMFAVGQPMGVFYGYETEGLFENEADILGHATQTGGTNPYSNKVDKVSGAWIGDLKFRDRDGDGVITDDDQSPIGVLGYEDSRTPIINFNINLSAAWRGFDIAAHITYIQNYEARHPFWGDGNTFQSIMGDQWHLADPTDINSELIPGRYPTMIAGNTNHINYTFSTFWMQDIWYLKLRNLTVGYTLPSKITKKAAISNLRFYASFQNLFSIDNVRTHTDPEIAQVAGFCYPTTRVYSIGFNLTF